MVRTRDLFRLFLFVACLLIGWFGQLMRVLVCLSPPTFVEVKHRDVLDILDIQGPLGSCVVKRYLVAFNIWGKPPTICVH